MDEQEQRLFLENLTSAIEEKAGCEVILKPWDAKGRRLSLRARTSDGTEKAFGFATIKPLKGCVGLTTWEKCLREVDPDTMPHWQLVENLEFRGPYGQKGWYCEANTDVYEEAVRVLTFACMYYLA